MSLTVNTTLGKLEGFQLGNCMAFRGIPFAKPPVEKLRFLPPQPAEPWAGVRPAKEYGKAAPQRITGIEFMDAGVPIDEDCLYLNIYTPSIQGARPVLFWIHGGGFSLGSGSQKGYNDPSLVSQGDVVLVTINYRVGPLGFIYLGHHGGNDWGASANLGLLDQIAALQWVKDNIAAFGGDPANVTIFGESAGSASVAALLAMPKARGLFHKAIGQSGTANLISVPEKAAQVTDRFLKALNIPAGDINKLQDMPWEQLIQAAQSIAEPWSVGFGNPMTSFWPVTDGLTIPQPPYLAVQKGSAKGIALLFGSNRDEAKFLELITGKPFPEIDDNQLLQYLQLFLGKWKEHAALLIEVYRKSRKAKGLAHNNASIFSAIVTDLQMRVTAIRLLEAQKPHDSRVYNYLFCWELPRLKAAIHGLEIGFVFGTVDRGNGADRIMSVSGPGVKALSANMMNAWIAFAKSGDPSIPGLHWEAYDTKKRATMIYDVQSRLENAPFEEERAVWNEVLRAS